jgi:hypothetical protein
MALDVQKLFNEELPAKLAKHGAAASQLAAKARIHVTGDGGGVWFIDASPSGPSATKGNQGGAHVGVTMSVEDFRTLVKNPENNARLLFSVGKIKVAGNRLLALKFTRLLMLDVG